MEPKICKVPEEFFLPKLHAEEEALSNKDGWFFKNLLRASEELEKAKAEKASLHLIHQLECNLVDAAKTFTESRKKLLRLSRRIVRIQKGKK